MLTQKAIKALKPRQRPYKASDGGGLYLAINPTGSKLWRWKYRVEGREKLLSLGIYPTVSLKVARTRRDEARQLLDQGIDPSAVKRAAKGALGDTFATISDEWLLRQRPKLAESTFGKVKQLIGLLLPRIGKRPIAKIQPPDLLLALREIESRGTFEAAKRSRQVAGRVFRYAISIGKAERDPSADLAGALTTSPVKHRSAITEPKAVGALLRTIDGYQGEPGTIAALKLLALLFVRPGELRLAKWSEFDLDAGQWVIPAKRTKMRKEHLVPLAPAAVEILRELHTYSGDGEFVFPSLRPGRAISENTLNYALRNLGISPDQHTCHGFRSTASTLLHELGYPPEVIELQLAHAQRNQVAAAYNRSARLAERKAMMLHWAKYLEGLRSGAKVIGIMKEVS
ncbi:MAG: DUF4102 domain-containing protein [Gammaproteobacteria bacterium]|nr:MAG: DUF4102 domain-containing protein [Gammaproteobacteria bacterium]